MPVQTSTSQLGLKEIQQPPEATTQPEAAVFEYSHTEAGCTQTSSCFTVLYADDGQGARYEDSSQASAKAADSLLGGTADSAHSAAAPLTQIPDDECKINLLHGF